MLIGKVSHKDIWKEFCLKLNTTFGDFKVPRGHHFFDFF